ncbi:hypothetical protein PGC08_14250 [Brevibacterium sp. BDJS002]|uniref:hypothetical protein n=1 Tax=Brevibacterium sp. BDJS002 TaxID=3020906 RepID=UPI00230805E3|nr:hypothetical protein [Brevibacterium sp. BDJS002]WCE39151.1 hypothetical protein PGC08_14250 [Brevibacterium sp. BDJS002]
MLHPDKAEREGQTLRLSSQIVHMVAPDQLKDDLLPTPSTIDGKPVDVKNQVATRNSPGLQCMPALLGMPEEVWPETDMTGNADRQAGEAERRRRLLPTPRASDGEKGGPNQRGSKGDLTVSSAVHLLPTPLAGDADNGNVNHPESRRSQGRSVGMQNVAPTIVDGFGPYADAIARWETVTGREAPAPTELTPKGKHRLSARFVEWMMGQSDGWVTDEELGLSRVQQLRALGNGVVTQQAVFAINWLIERAQDQRRKAA